MNKQTPEYFYQYTTIENLALILKNRTIRFTRADLVNDLEEINIIDKPELKKSVFISCWTIVEEESIPMWALYTNKSKGVRIKLKLPIFDQRWHPKEIQNHNCKIMLLRPFKNFIQRENDNEWVKYLFGPIEVSYMADTQVSVLGKDNSLIVEKIGTVKSEHWKFENEFRFLALANHEWNSETDSFELKNEKYYSEVVADYFDIEIDESIFNNIEILLGPNCKEPEKIIVESMIEKHTTNGALAQSKLRDKIKLQS